MTIIDRIAHTTAFDTPVMENWLKQEIAQWVHDERSIWLPITASTGLSDCDKWENYHLCGGNYHLRGEGITIYGGIIICGGGNYHLWVGVIICGGGNYHLKPPSACYRFWSDCPYSLVPASVGGHPLLPPPLLPPPLFFPVPDRGTGEGRYLCPWEACATTACSECAH